ncbi:hypothetical protein HVTV-2_gp59 [Haloarcula virus HVTV-2]|uniref:Uncharacterized protein n=1 Tax=Haloarcula vallismortis tailed virus 1 TaxID=1262528 RepID=L7TGV0_9CAUD|nr:hypothetical protein HVTV1_60 [Haloarcula vallismortis tailed virus 1]AGC34429.1 hypothetical protein HVTV1_60 [Haloarcula vallismortis tailed virus 1]UBF22866.1 hypothetical protein HVTV-2_gp59 [Haloarcula virus HVTV-2]
MTRTRLYEKQRWIFRFEDMTSDDDVQKFEAKLRVLKKEEYQTMGEVVGTTLETESGEYPIFEEDESLDNVRVGIGVETDDGRRIMTQMSPPEMWDLTNELVVILEYLDLEPEEFHDLGSGDRELPVTFDVDDETYRLDFERMRDVLLEDE